MFCQKCAMNGSTMYRNVVILVLIALTSCMAFGMPGREEMEAARVKCAEEVGFDPAAFKGPPPPGELKDKSKIHCFHACMMKQAGAMNEDGTVDVEKAVELLPPDIPDREKVVEAIKECSTMKGENDCETAHEIHKCMHEKHVLPMHHHHEINH